MARRLALLLVVAGALAIAAPANASNPNHELGCQGSNNVPCRPDPQPTHGNDCSRSDDHSCSTTTTTPQPTTTTTARVIPITTTTTLAPLPSLIIHTDPKPSTTSTTLTTTSAQALVPPSIGSTTTTSPESPSSATTNTTQLAATGAGSKALTILGLWFVIGGLVALGFGKLLKG